MPIQSPFHERTSALCKSYRWKEWAGYLAVCSYDTCHEREYIAFRHSSGLIDVTPLFKYDIYGPDAAKFLSYVIAKDVKRLRIGQGTYCCWCDEAGKILDDGTVTRLDEDFFRVTAAEPSFAWFEKLRRGYKVEIEDRTHEIAALSLQGPHSKSILKNLTDAQLDSLKFFHATQTKIDGHSVMISRTGYTGDLGFEVWMPNDSALPVWDAIMASGKSFGIEAAGLDAMDITRVEAGYIMNGVDYYSSNRCINELRKSTPYELGLGWTIQLDREPFIGSEALKREKVQGSQWQFVGLDIDWMETEALYSKYNLPPAVSSAAWRTGVPVYNASGSKQIGFASSGAWSPTLKRNLALAHLQAPYVSYGSKVKFEMTVEYERNMVSATIVKPPFYDPPRKKS